MPETPALRLPAPWGAAVAIGLIQVALQPEATAYRGQVSVIQGESQRFTHSQRCLIIAADRARLNLFSGTDYIRLCLAQGLVGWADLVDCWTLNDPACPFDYDFHFNLGQDRPPHPHLWVLANAQVVPDDPDRKHEPPPARPAQAAMFTGSLL